jgi:hypothetical protein
MPPSRTGEVYALWAEVPGNVAYSDEVPLHGTSKSKLLSTFTVNDTGGIIGLDLAKAAAAVTDRKTILDFEVSIERPDNIGDKSAAVFLSGDVTGSSSEGTATLTQADDHAFGDVDFTSITSVATLGSAAKTPAKDSGEVYLMNATSPTNTSPGLMPPTLPFLEGTWRYAVWTVDSTHTHPVFTFLGYVISPDAKDSKSAKDSYPYPGGKSPSDTALYLTDLTNGNCGVFLNLEPAVLAGDPTMPFTSWILWTRIPLGQPFFQPFPLANIYQNSNASVDAKFSR